MGALPDPTWSESDKAARPSNRRLLVLMAVVGVFGAILAAIFISALFAVGVIIGTAFAFINYFWLQRSLRTIFSVAGHGERPKMLAGTYFLRYVVLALAIAVIYVAGWVPITSVIAGMAAFGFATVIEGFIRIGAGIFSN